MKKFFLSLLCLSAAFTASAQEKFMTRLLKSAPGQGTVHVVQDAEITRLVNGVQDVRPADTSASAADQTVRPGVLPLVGEDDETVRPFRKMKVNGYRIQVYAGGNSRTAREEAQRMAAKVKSYFSDLATYTHFQSPRWICRVGDFRTYEEASQALHEMRATNQFSEALIVKSVIQISY